MTQTPRRPAGAKAFTALLVAFSTTLACAGGAARPAPLDTRNEPCASCRMSVSATVFASQIVAPGEVPRFFDDLGCLADYLKAGKAPKDATAFVADHRTREWVRAERAVYTRVDGLATPMASHVIAHADLASRDQDPDARGGRPVEVSAFFGSGFLPVGGNR